MGERRVTADGRILERGPDGTVQVVGTVGGVPSNPLKMQEATTGIAGTQATTQGKQLDNRVAAATVAPRIQQAGAEADKTAAMATNAQQDLRLNGLPAATYDAAIKQFNGAGMIYSAKSDMQDKFQQGPGSTTGMASALDFLPGMLRPSNQRFDKAADAARGNIVQGLALTGGSVNSPAEAQLWTGPYVPRSSDFDQTNRDSFNRLDAMRNNAAKTAIMTLGGVPDASGNIHPLGSPEATAALERIGLPGTFGMPGQQAVQDQNAPPMIGMTGGGDGPQGGGGNDGMPSLAMQNWSNGGNAQPQTVASGDLLGPKQRKEYDYEAQAHFQKMVMSGAGADDFQAEAQRMGFDAFDPAALNAVLEWHRKFPKDNRPMVNPPLKQVDQTALERVSQGVPGAAGIGLANAGSFGVLGGIAPEQMAMARTAHPYAEMVGEAGGAIWGTNKLGGLINRIPGGIAAKASPLARNIATDASYGTIYGGASNPDNPGAGAAMGLLGGAGGSLLGNAAGGAVGAAVGGLKTSAPAQYLASRGIPMTTGQLLGGGFKALEDRLAGLPGFGVIGKRRTEAFQDFNRAARNEAGAPINAQFAPGGNWMEDLPPQFGQAYDNATAGVQVPLDGQFPADMAGARAAGAALPDDLAGKFDTAINNRVGPIATAGELTGDSYQQSMRGLRGYKAEHTKPGFEEDYRGALTKAQDALRGQMERGGGQSVVDGLGKADQAYRLGKVLQTAQRGAVNGTRSGEPGLMVPSQLNSAAMANLKKFGGQRPFAQLGDAGQEVLPNAIPDSGTAGRLAQFAAPAALLGGGQASDSMGWTENAGANTLKLAIAYAMLRGGGSKMGQSAINGALFNRPDWAKSLANIGGGKLKGLFGSALVPLAIEQTH